MLQPDGSQKIHPARGEVLNAAQPLLLYDEEVPREGVHVTLGGAWRAGSTARHWSGPLSAQVGRGEGSSGLRFDQAIAPSNGS